MFVIKKQIIKVSKDFQDTRIDYWLKKNYPTFHYFFLCKLIRKGVVKINGRKCKQNNKLKENDQIKIPNILLKTNKTSDKKISTHLSKLVKSWVIHKNKDILVINKPNGIAVQGGSKIKINIDLLLDSLKYSNLNRPKIVHRLDKDTSGILMLARNLETAKYLSLLFKERKIKKLYLAIVYGDLNKSYNRLNSNIIYNGKVHLSETHFWKLKSNNKYSLLLVKPITGRKHQIRKHLISKKIQILGDKKYILYNDQSTNDESLNLHAYYYSYFDSLGKSKSFRAEIPQSFLNNLKKLKIEFDENNINLDQY